MPGLVTMGLINFINAWNNLLYPLSFTTSPSSKTLSVSITEVFAGSSPWGKPWELIMAVGVTMTHPDRDPGHLLPAGHRARADRWGHQITEVSHVHSQSKPAEGPVDTTRSPHARLQTLGLQDVALQAGFWSGRQAVNRHGQPATRLRDAGESGQL